MNLLAIDTATEACSVAAKTTGGVHHRFEVCPRQHSQRLLPMVDEVLKEAGIGLTELDGLVYGRGPGSFTGVRIATGMIQGLSLGTGLKVAGVSTLAAMAQQAFEEHGATAVAAATDARMGETYFARYVEEGGLVHLQGREVVCPPAEAVDAVTDSDFPVGTGWDAYTELTAKKQGEVTVLYPDARYMLALGARQFRDGEVSHAQYIDPVYLRDKVTWKKLPGR